ncbi:MAG: S26 family signal peptidase [Candidatus Thalassarchaeaceae archaeon]|jgi:signal peptidase|nr:S26 family signal peptidase [Candidatus Thalassarchaeaceae archaeon]
MGEAWSWTREALLAGGLITALVAALVLMTGSWPPMVVIESGSMMHENEGNIGAIDPGDLVLVMSPEKKQIITYVESIESGNGYESHGMPGDVIIFSKNGGSDTPVIHRAILRVDAHTTETPVNRDIGECENGSWDPITVDLDGEEGTCVLTWSIPGTNVSNVETITVEIDYPCFHYGNLTIEDWNPVHAGYLTTGDNSITNGCSYDQKGAHSGGLLDENGQRVLPVRDDWIIGVAGAEIPWVGSVKLALSDNSEQVPSASWTKLIFSAIVLLAIPAVWERIANKSLELTPEVIQAEIEEKTLQFEEEE